MRRWGGVEIINVKIQYQTATFTRPLEEAVAGTILGKDEFVSNIKKILRGKKAKERDLPALRELRIRPTLREIEKEVEREFGDDRRGKRKVGIYLSRRYSGKTLREIVEWYGNIKESGVSQIVRRFSLERGKDRYLDRKVVDIENRLQELEGML